MMETPLQKIRRIRDALRVAVSFDGVDFQESTDDEVRCMGGFETLDLDNIIRFDPLAVSMASDDVLTFILIHEHWHLGKDGVSAEESRDETKADEHALYKLKSIGWDFGRARRCLADFKSHEQEYFTRLHQQRLEVLEMWDKVVQFQFTEIWNKAGA